MRFKQTRESRESLETSENIKPGAPKEKREHLGVTKTHHLFLLFSSPISMMYRLMLFFSSNYLVTFCSLEKEAEGFGVTWLLCVRGVVLLSNTCGIVKIDLNHSHPDTLLKDKHNLTSTVERRRLKRHVENSATN